MSHSLVAYDYINHDYDKVRAAVVADPQALFARATSSGSSAELHASVGALELGAKITIALSGVVEETREDFKRPTTTLNLEWRAEHRPGMFPVMHATLSVYPLTPTETQLELSGIYDPPLGALGDVIDAAGLHKFAESSVERFVKDIAQCLRRELSA